jgi:aerotolerance regulator-like protein/VWA domain-containing protein
MILALTFAAPLLLIGLLAAGIPFLLHLLYRVRAREVYFPSLRFLQASIQRTARRRRIQHWLLLALRSLLLLLLALAVAEPMTRLAGTWLSGNQTAVVIVLDNSLSMGAVGKDGSRLSRAQIEATALLSGDAKPALAALLTTSQGSSPTELTGQLEEVREALRTTQIRYGPSGLAGRVDEAMELLAATTTPRKVVYVFSDLQRKSFEPLTQQLDAARTANVDLFIIDCAGEARGNVGITDVSASPDRVIGQTMEIAVSVRNFHPEARTVNVSLRVGQGQAPLRARVGLRPAGEEGQEGVVRFSHRVDSAEFLTGEASIESARGDCLLEDDTRSFCFRTARRVRALIVAPPGRRGEPVAMSPAGMLEVALDPYRGGELWPIELRRVEADRFAPVDLDRTDVAFFCNVATFDEAQSEAIRDFVRRGGTAVFFPGSETDVENYNRRLVDETGTMALLPARLAAPTGQLGPDAGAALVEWADLSHPFLEGLYPDLEGYRDILVQRHFALAPSPRPSGILIRLDTGEPLLLVRRFGDGLCVLWTTPASPQWSNLPITGLFLPVVTRTCLLARSRDRTDPNYLANTQVPIRIPRESPVPSPEELSIGSLRVLPPDALAEERGDVVALHDTDSGPRGVYTQAIVPGLYRWALEEANPESRDVRGAFAIWGDSAESDLRRVDLTDWRSALADRGVERVFVGQSVAAAHADADAAARGRNWWDVLLATVLLLLVAEALIANRRRTVRDDAIPARMKPGALPHS